jgi:hypothetical protein
MRLLFVAVLALALVGSAQAVLRATDSAPTPEPKAACPDGSAVLPLIEIRRERDEGGDLVDRYYWGGEQCEPPAPTPVPPRPTQPPGPLVQRIALPLVLRHASPAGERVLAVQRVLPLVLNSAVRRQ